MFKLARTFPKDKTNVLKFPFSQMLGIAYLLLQAVDLQPLVVELVALLPDSPQQLSDTLLLAVDHLLAGVQATIKVKEQNT